MKRLLSFGSMLFALPLAIITTQPAHSVTPPDAGALATAPSADVSSGHTIQSGESIQLARRGGGGGFRGGGGGFRGGGFGGGGMSRAGMRGPGFSGARASGPRAGNLNRGSVNRGNVNRANASRGNVNRTASRTGNRTATRNAGTANRGNANRAASRTGNRTATRNGGGTANRNANRNVDRNVNRNVNRNINRETVGAGGWTRPASYWWRPGGAVAAGAALGYVSAATAAAWAGSPPVAGYCWYYTDQSQHEGFWDQCP